VCVCNIIHISAHYTILGWSLRRWRARKNIIFRVVIMKSNTLMHFNFMTGFLCPFGLDNTHTHTHAPDGTGLVYVYYYYYYSLFLSLSNAHTHTQRIYTHRLIDRCYKFDRHRRFSPPQIVLYYNHAPLLYYYFDIILSYDWWYYYTKVLIFNCRLP